MISDEGKRLEQGLRKNPFIPNGNRKAAGGSRKLWEVGSKLDPQI